MTYTPTDDELSKGLHAVFYEIQQLAFTPMLSTPDAGINNAIVESRLLHVRTLLDFFEDAAKQKDDVLAVHYGFPSRPIEEVEAVYRERLNKDLAHLTYSRTRRTQSDKQWPYDRVVVPVIERCHLFAEHVLATPSIYARINRDDWQGLVAVLAAVRTAFEV